jgi:secretion/DNA translocation related TadE-like protein
MTRERGSGTIWVLALSAVILLAAFAGGAWGLAATARHRAEAAADLAALAAASESLWGQERACATAAQIAAENGASLGRCRMVGDIADIRVTRPLGIRGLPHWIAVAEARAGPVPGVEPLVGLRANSLRYGMDPAASRDGGQPGPPSPSLRRLHPDRVAGGGQTEGEGRRGAPHLLCLPSVAGVAGRARPGAYRAVDALDRTIRCVGRGVGP